MSYHAETLPILSPTTLVKDKSIIAEFGLWLKSIETNFSSVVSIDFNHNPSSAIIDLSLTNVVGNNMGKVSAWYDNEWGFVSRMCDLANYFGKI